MTQADEDLFQQAYRLQRQNQLPEAISLYEALLKACPDHEHGLHYLGLAFAQLGDMDSALHYLQQALRINPKNPALHNNLANVYKKLGQEVLAIDSYQQALTLDPDYAQAHNNLASLLQRQGEFTKALQQYRLAVHAEPDFTAAHFNLGLLLLKMNQLAAAETQFRNVLSLNPDYPEASFYLGVLALEKNQLAQAKQAFLDALDMDPEHLEALINLGVIALKQNQAQQAIDLFSRALALDNDNLDARKNLASTFMHYDRFENALSHYQILLQAEPKEPEYLYNAGVAQMALGHLQEAIQLFTTLILHNPQHFAALSNLAVIQLRLGNREEAKQLLEQALAVNPEDESSQHLYNALSGKQAGQETHPAYARQLFDNYALYYDKHLQDYLQYSLPEQIAKELMLLKQPASTPGQADDLPAPSMTSYQHCLDLGCGTGLSGEQLKPFCQSLTGVDISAKMIEQARQKALYDHLEVSEGLSFLAEAQQGYDLIVAADLLPYLGDLASLFKAVSDHLDPKGFFVFNTEISDEFDYTLQENARFSHHPDYILRLAGVYHLTLVKQTKISARVQEDKPLAQYLYILEKK